MSKEKTELMSASISRRLVCVVVMGVLREMITSFMYDAKNRDKYVITNMKDSADKFFYNFDRTGNNDNSYMESAIESLMNQAEEILGDKKDYESRRLVFTIFLISLVYYIYQYRGEVVYEDSQILYGLLLVGKTPARHFEKQNKLSVEESLKDVLGHIESIRERTEKILNGED